MSESKNITLADIAKACDLSVAGVSLSLRNHPRIPAATRRRVQQVSEEMGYEKNRRVSQLMSEIRKGTDRGSYKETLAYLYDPEAGRADHWPEPMEAGIRARAQALGYGLERFDWQANGISDQRLTKMLRSRGIQGLIISPLRRGGMEMTLDWERFSTVAIGYSLSQPGLHRVVRDLPHGLQMAYEKLRALGYRRIGMVAKLSQEIRTDRVCMAVGLLESWSGAASDQVAPLAAEDWSPEVLKAWLQREQPEVVVSLLHEIPEWMEDLGWRVPADIGFFDLAVVPKMKSSGLYPNYEAIGAAAVDRVSSLLESGSSGLPEAAETIMIPGKWRHGTTITESAGMPNPN